MSSVVLEVRFMAYLCLGQLVRNGCDLKAIFFSNNSYLQLVMNEIGS
jgi:hypothetical protein